MSEITNARILVVDDDPGILDVLTTALEAQGHSIITASSGEAAVDVAATSAVDLAIVDVRLPGIDGVEVTERLKAPRAAADDYLPVVLITATDDTHERIRAFRSGCDDFLGKPVNLFELEARVRSLLARRAQHVELAKANARLRQLQVKKRDLASLVVHDLRNPLSALQGNIELLREELHGTSEFTDEVIDDCFNLAGRALFLANGLLDVEELEEGILSATVADVDVAALVRTTSKHHTRTVEARGLELDFRVADGLRGKLDPELIGRVVENLLDNSVRYANRNGRVVVSAELVDGELVICVGNDGPPIDDEERARIFDRYYRLDARRAGARANRGLGLYFCRLAAQAHGGTIDITSYGELPAVFRLTLPQDSTSS